MGLDLFKLEKLKIKAYKDAKRTPAAMPEKTFEAMFNPSSLQQTYKNVWAKRQGVNTSGKELSYQRSDPSSLDLDLLLDGTGVDQMGVLSIFGSTQTVGDRIKDFLDTAYGYDGDIHQPRYLKVEWGKFSFDCRLESVAITYTTFDRDGTPLRADLKITLLSDEETERLKEKEDKKSPDLTHSRVFRAGDTLPLLSRQIYGSANYYLDLARFNGLDDFRNIAPGQQVLFPPLETLLSQR